jgi:putative transposase
MIIRKAFRFRLCPNENQLQIFLRFVGACRWVYNRGLAERKLAWESAKQSISLFNQNKALTGLKEQEATSWLKEVHSQILQQSLHDLDQAFLHFFRRVKKKETPGHPRFKCKGEKDSFRYPQGVKIQEDRVWLPKIGWIRFRKSREVQGDIKQTTVIKEGKHWYVCFSCEWTEVDQTSCAHEKNVVGIDLGLENFATIVSDTGFEEIPSPRFLRKGLSHLKYLSRQLSKKVKFSKNWCAAKAKLQIFHAKIRHSRLDFLHKLSTRLVKNHDVIAVENLKIQKLQQTSERSLARSIADAGWRQFLQMLKYKCAYAYKQLAEAEEFFPSTQLCSQCNCRNRITLSMRQYSCSCGFVIHRDRNAALNLQAVGMTV